MPFPDHRYADVGSYAASYFTYLAAAAATVDPEKLEEATRLLTRVYQAGGIVYSAGNGGSAAIANHLVCDHCKSIRTGTALTPRVVSLSTTVEIITAIGNDISYDAIFVHQLGSLARPGDALITISSSGDSENIVRAVAWARDHQLPVVAMTGFSGGRSAKMATVNLHVAAENYGVVEDVHQSLMHILAHYLRQAHMDEHLIASGKF